MTRAIIVRAHGGPEEMRLETVPDPVPGPGEILVRHTVIGLNYIDTYFRSGLYPPPGGLPFTPGGEAAAIVEAAGPDVTGFPLGTRVVYAGLPGAYSERRCLPADRAVEIPATIDDDVAASIFLKGLTARYLLCETCPVHPDMTILFHAAAGGVGLLAGQLGAHIGAMMIGTAGSDEKARLAGENGYDHVISPDQENFVERVRDITDGLLCDVVFDSIGKDSLVKSLDCIRRRGMLVSFGQSSGKAHDLDLQILAQKGSLYLTRPTLFDYIATRDELLSASHALFDLVEKGVLRPHIGKRYALEDVRQAHIDLQSRRTRGASLIIPGRL